MRRQRLAISIGAGIVIIILAIIFNSATISRQLHSWKLLPSPEKLTELYFTRPNNLPTTYFPGKNQNVQFTIHNLEYQKENYHYVISVANNQGQQVTTLTQGDVVLMNGQYDKVSVNVILPDLGTREKITTTLTNVNESIDYWVNKVN